MIPLHKLRAGLAALAEISHAKVDGATEQLWAHATRELTAEQWRHGVDVTIRTWRSTWMPPPAVVIDAAYTAPLPQRTQPIRESYEQAWASPEQEGSVQDVVRANPRAPGENPVRYIERIAALAGLRRTQRANVEPAAAAPLRCDCCDPSFGCFDGSASCSKAPLPRREPGQDG